MADIFPDQIIRIVLIQDSILLYLIRGGPFHMGRMLLLVLVYLTFMLECVGYIVKAFEKALLFKGVNVEYG